VSLRSPRCSARSICGCSTSRLRECGLTPTDSSMAYESLAAHVVGRKAGQDHGARKRHNPEQVVRKLTAADRLLAEGKDTAAVCRELGVSDASYHQWRNQFGGLKAEDAKRLKDLKRRTRPSDGCWPMPSWRRTRCGRSRRETFRPGMSAGGRSSPAARAGGQRAVRLSRPRAAPRHPASRIRRGDAGRSGCCPTGVAADLRQEASPPRLPSSVPRRWW
jgi:putative transposase